MVHLSINGVGSSPELKSKGAVLLQSTEHHEFWADRRLFLDKVAHLRVSPDILRVDLAVQLKARLITCKPREQVIISLVDNNLTVLQSLSIVAWQ